MDLPGKDNTDTKVATALLLALVSADIAFVLGHYLMTIGVLDDGLFSLERDRGYPEFFQYAKALSIVILLLLVSARSKVIGFGVWALLFLYLLLDDALQMHEVYGGYIAAYLNFAPAIGLRAQDFGEVAVSAIAGASFLALLAIFYVTGSRAFRKSSRHLLLLLMALAFFGVFIDLLHVAVDMGWRITWLLGVVEDGGEMVVMSLMAWYVFLLNTRDGDIRSPVNIT